MSFRPPHTPELEGDAELVRLEHERKIVELQKMPASATKHIRDVVLADGTSTPIAHGLGRRPVFWTASGLRGATAAGFILDVRDGSYDLTKYLVLEANDYGATITVDLEVK